MRQFYVEPSAAGAYAPGERVTLDREESHHLLGVLRGAEGRVWRLVDGRGRRYEAVIVGRRGRLAELEISTACEDSAETRAPRLALACAVVKGKRFEWALEKAVELGVHRVRPLACERGVVEPGAGRQERWRGVILAALKQSGRSLLPELDEPATPATVLADASPARHFWGALPEDPGEDAPVRVTVLDLAGTPPDPLPGELMLWVGPEGGWSAAEAALLRQAQATPLDLGPHVLRTETAAAAGLVQLQLLRRAWGDAGGRPAPLAP